MNFKEKIKFADNMEMYAHGVIIELSKKMGPEAACIRVMQRLSLVLQAGWESTPPEEVALVLLPRRYPACDLQGHYIANGQRPDRTGSQPIR